MSESSVQEISEEHFWQSVKKSKPNPFPDCSSQSKPSPPVLIDLTKDDGSTVSPTGGSPGSKNPSLEHALEFARPQPGLQPLQPQVEAQYPRESLDSGDSDGFFKAFDNGDYRHQFHVNHHVVPNPQNCQQKQAADESTEQKAPPKPRRSDRIKAKRSLEEA